ncbi:hypothetical protein SUGI_0646030 [Cryptomeria japonica]|nr:hypothetical protein SUGI_0646030 [Cryptomeria japonica]
MLLEYPSALKAWSNSTDFCNLTPSPSITIVCYEDTITQLRIVGDKGSHLKGENGKFFVSNKTLSSAFSLDSFMTTLYKLSSLKVLSLVSLGLWGPLPGKIGRLSSLDILNVSSNYFYGNIPQELSLLRNLHTLILDDNMFNGTVPDWLSAFPSLTSLSFKNNFFSGALPSSLSTLQTLRVLHFSGNQLSGDLPDLSSLINLQELDLQDNSLGPLFPTLGKKLVIIILRKNSFRFHIPTDLESFNQLQQLDLSFNDLIGLPPSYLFSLPSIQVLNFASNTFTGTLPQNLTCNSGLSFVDLSSNFLTGNLPSCLASLVSQKRTVNFSQNCLSTKLQYQHPESFCKNAATATGVHPQKSKKESRTVTVAIVLGIIGGIVGIFAVLGLLLLVLLRKAERKKLTMKPPRRLVAKNVSTGFSSDLLANARYISQTMRLGALGLPQYRPFAMEELEEATHNFSPSFLIGEGSHGKLYRGRLEDGTFAVIRCLKFEWRYTIRNLKIHLELLSKLRHRHLVSLLGHCIDYEHDGLTVKRIFLIFEYVPNGTLRSNLSGQLTEEVLSWPQRLAAAIGVARGVHFLHTGVVPGIFHNNLKITNVLLDQNRVSKLKGYNLPILAEGTDDLEVKTESYNLVHKEAEIKSRKKFLDKGDIYNFGLILLETIIGRPPILPNQETDKIQELMNIMSDCETRSQIVDPIILRTSIDESLATVIEITGKCLSKDPVSRPSMEDVLWNLQYAAQVQDTSVGDLESGDDSPVNFPIGLKSGYT